MNRAGGVPDPVLAEIRRICLAFPEAAEQETWGHPTFRVRAKILAGCGVSDEAEPVVTMTMKAATGEQDSLPATGHPFFLPKYVGSKGWIGFVIDGATDWSEVAELVEDSYREIAPKRLVAESDT
ncbi:MAG TPA: MmcQ/YjbR family DNA-binding protein [Acidimicrobiia bacterium]|nr:MmcQ/YjbR family DNA-binding protein [Acidimicrobiia bacterium]